jgi:hypothetical protein
MDMNFANTLKVILNERRHEIGASPNDKANGGSSALETALWHMSLSRFDPFDPKRLRSKYQLSQTLDCVRVLLEHGAIWNPDDAYHVNSLRKTLLECEPDVTIELLQMFRKHNACPAERVHRLLGTPRIEEHLRGQASALLRLGINLGVRPNARRSGRVLAVFRGARVGAFVFRAPGWRFGTGLLLLFYRAWTDALG